MNETEAQALYQTIFSADRIERWKSWKGHRDTKSCVQECGDHPLAGIPQKKQRWNGGVTHSSGYRFVLVPNHPRASANGHVLEHILVAEIVLGRFLPDGAVVHHVNENKLDNRPENLVICESKAHHNMIHRRMRALKSCGNPDWLRCCYCKKWDAPENMVLRIAPNRIAHGMHQKCGSDYNKAKWREKNWTVHDKVLVAL